MQIAMASWSRRRMVRRIRIHMRERAAVALRELAALGGLFGWLVIWWVAGAHAVGAHA